MFQIAGVHPFRLIRPREGTPSSSSHWFREFLLLASVTTLFLSDRGSAGNKGSIDEERRTKGGVSYVILTPADGGKRWPSQNRVEHPSPAEKFPMLGNLTQVFWEWRRVL